MKTLAITAAALLLTVAILINLLPGPWSPNTTKMSNRRYLRVVALAPSLSETMVALNQQHRLVGVTIHCQSERLAHIQKIGSFAEPNFEAIMALKPDLVLAVPHVMAKRILDKLASNNIEIFAHQPDSLNDIKFIISTLAEKLGIEKDGAKLNHRIDHSIEQAKELVSHLDLGVGARGALIAISHMPFVVAGKNTFPSQIIEALGLTNLANDEKTAWPIWPMENLLSHPPQFLILADGKESFHKYHHLFTLLGMDLSSGKVRLIVPERPIFSSPSPALIEDTIYLTSLLQSGI